MATAKARDRMERVIRAALDRGDDAEHQPAIIAAEVACAFGILDWRPWSEEEAALIGDGARVLLYWPREGQMPEQMVIHIWPTTTQFLREPHRFAVVEVPR